VTAAQANAVVNLLFKQSLQARAGAQPSARELDDIRKASVELTPVSRGLSLLRRQFSLSLKVLMGVVALVLLIASANVANLMLAHGASRSREFAVRLAIGAGRLRLVRQLFTEGALLALFGAIIGVALSWWGSRLLLAMASDRPEAVPVDVTPNLRVLGFTIGVSALCAIVFGAAPALRAARTEPNTSLKNKTTSALKNPLGKTFVVVQVALYGVARRTNEIGIRMALGAPGRSVLWLVLREALLLVAIGLDIGVLASLAVTKTAASLLYELKPNDPLTIAGATLLLAAVALVAGYLPARRASKVDPLVALRYE